LTGIAVLMATVVALFYQDSICIEQLAVGLFFLFIALLYFNNHYAKIYDWLLYLHSEKRLEYIKDVSEQFSYIRFIKRIPNVIYRGVIRKVIFLKNN
ncbi:MAG: hypothetical protein U9Q37_09395, partial [Euryarchaeota archaeon]|nr:hypothetical protein [Euryarchaeota archaeon]